MKNIFKSLFVFLLVGVLTFKVNAACTDKKLNDFIEKLKIEFVYPETESKYAYYFKLSEKEYDGKKIEETLELEALDGEMKPGIWQYQELLGEYGVGGYTNIEEETYTLNVKAISETCKGETLKHDTYTIPQFNKYIQTSYCEKYPTHELCQRFTNKTSEMNDSDFSNAMKDYEKKNEPKKSGILEFLKNNIGYILCVILPVLIISIYFNNRIKRYTKMRNRSEGRRPNRLGLFILFLFLFSMKVYAVSDPGQCVAIEQVRTGKWVPGTQVSVYHMGYDDEDRYEGSDHVSWDYSPNDGGGDTYTIDRNYTDSMYHHYSDVDYGHGAIGEKSQTFNSGDKFEGISNYGSGSKDGVEALPKIPPVFASIIDITIHSGSYFLLFSFTAVSKNL